MGGKTKLTQKASKILISGDVVTVTVPAPHQGMSNLRVYEEFFGDYVDFAKTLGFVPKLNLALIVVPFTTLLPKEEQVILIYNTPPYDEIVKIASSALEEKKDLRELPSIHLNEVATQLIAELNGEDPTKIIGPALVVALCPGNDLYPRPDFQVLYELIIDDLSMVVENNSTGGMLGNEGNMKKKRFEMLVMSYRAELKQKENTRAETYRFKGFIGGMRGMYSDTVSIPRGDKMAAYVLSHAEKMQAEYGDDWFKVAQKNDEAGIKMCTFCCKTMTEPKACGGCHEEYYCSKDCQVSDWKAHKKTCKKNAKSKNAHGSDAAAKKT